MSRASSLGRTGRSIVSVLGGFVAVFVLSVGTDIAMQAAGIFPSFSEPNKFTTPLLLLATLYRSAYTVVGGYVTASLAPDRPVGHAVALGVLGLAMSIFGAVTMWNVGPHWYPLALVVLSLPCTWVGGRLRAMRAAA
jgi:hypothetical protein